jgi:hypothetical protein
MKHRPRETMPRRMLRSKAMNCFLLVAPALWRLLRLCSALYIALLLLLGKRKSNGALELKLGTTDILVVVA